MNGKKTCQYSKHDKTKYQYNDLEQTGHKKAITFNICGKALSAFDSVQFVLQSYHTRNVGIA